MPIRRNGVAISAIILIIVMSGCGSDPVEIMPANTTPEVVAMLKKATPHQSTPEQVAEAFALGSDSTDLQRDLMEKDLVGSVVEWDLEVYEIAYVDGLYRIMSQPFPITSTEAVPLIRAVAMVHALDEKEKEMLETAKTGSVLLIRGLVRAIEYRTIVIIGPAIVTARQ